MYSFSISNGLFRHNGILFGTGWAGQGIGRNNPDAQKMPDIGPLPIGKYTIGKAYDHTLENGYTHNLGPVVMDLTPDPANEMFGRKDFRIHGASLLDPARSSEGCIILPRPVREAIDTGIDKDLEVTE